jgi:hypothetical protein
VLAYAVNLSCFSVVFALPFNYKLTIAIPMIDLAESCDACGKPIGRSFKHSKMPGTGSIIENAVKSDFNTQ